MNRLQCGRFGIGRSRPGQLLLEVVVAMGVLTLFALAFATLALGAYTDPHRVDERLKAVYGAWGALEEGRFRQGGAMGSGITESIRLPGQSGALVWEPVRRRDSTLERISGAVDPRLQRVRSRVRWSVGKRGGGTLEMVTLHARWRTPRWLTDLEEDFRMSSLNAAAVQPAGDGGTRMASGSLRRPVLVSRIPVQREPRALHLDPVADLLYVLTRNNPLQGELLVYDIADAARGPAHVQQVDAVELSAAGTAFAFTDTRIYVLTEHSDREVVVVDRATREVLTAWNLPKDVFARDIAVHPERGLAYVTMSTEAYTGRPRAAAPLQPRVRRALLPSWMRPSSVYAQGRGNTGGTGGQGPPGGSDGGGTGGQGPPDDVPGQGPPGGSDDGGTPTGGRAARQQRQRRTAARKLYVLDVTDVQSDIPAIEREIETGMGRKLVRVGDLVYLASNNIDGEFVLVDPETGEVRSCDLEGDALVQDMAVSAGSLVLVRGDAQTAEVHRYRLDPPPRTCGELMESRQQRIPDIEGGYGLSVLPKGDVAFVLGGYPKGRMSVIDFRTESAEVFAPGGEGGRCSDVTTLGGYLYATCETAEGETVVALLGGEQDREAFLRRGTVTSPPFDAGAESVSWNTIRWSAGGEGSVSFRLRMAATKEGLREAHWTGSGGTVASRYTQRTGETIKPPPAVNGTRWIQWKAYLHGNGHATPVLEDVILTFDTPS